MTGGNPETWLAARLAAGKPAETWKPVPAWYYEQIGLPVPAVPHQASDQGGHRSPNGIDLATRPNGRPRELPPQEQYRLVNLSVGGVKKTVHAAHPVLAAHCPEARDGRDVRHLGRGRACRAWNWWPEGIAWGTRSENEMDKPEEVRVAAAAKGAATRVAAGLGAPPATFKCVNYIRCGAMVVTEGRRCEACFVQVGKGATVLLNAGMRFQDVGEHFGYTAGDWTYKLAVEHGGYARTKAQARMQRPTLWQCVRLIWIKRRVGG